MNKKYFIAALFLLFAGFLIYLAVKNPDIMKGLYLWLIGLFGIIFLPFKKLWDLVSPSKELKEIEQDNARLKLELAQIRKALADARSTLEEERRKNRLKIEALRQSINTEDDRVEAIRQELERLKKQSPEEVKNAMNPEERKKFSEDTWQDVDFGLQ